MREIMFRPVDLKSIKIWNYHNKRFFRRRFKFNGRTLKDKPAIVGNLKMNELNRFVFRKCASFRTRCILFFIFRKKNKQNKQIKFSSILETLCKTFSFLFFFSLFLTLIFFSLSFFPPIILKLTLSMSINWNVLLWNIGIFNKMDQSRCAIWTLLINTHIPLSSLTFSQKKIN